jgi:hypothetical protein
MPTLRFRVGLNSRMPMLRFRMGLGRSREQPNVTIPSGLSASPCHTHGRVDFDLVLKITEERHPYKNMSYIDGPQYIKHLNLELGFVPA